MLGCWAQLAKLQTLAGYCLPLAVAYAFEIAARRRFAASLRRQAVGANLVLWALLAGGGYGAYCAVQGTAAAASTFIGA